MSKRRVRAPVPAARTHPDTVPCAKMRAEGTSFSRGGSSGSRSNSNHCSSTSMALANIITTTGTSTTITRDRGRGIKKRMVRKTGRRGATVSCRLGPNLSTGVVPLAVWLLIILCGDFTRLGGEQGDGGGGGGVSGGVGVLADELTTQPPPEETWTTSSNENVGTGEAAPFNATGRGIKKFGDKCESTTECGFAGSFCDPKKHTCQCTVDLPATNHIDKCGKKRQVNETCFFSEQCEAVTEQTECRDGRCICLFEMNAIFKPDGSVECRAPINKPIEPEKYIDPAMIGVLVAMAVMFIIICVVLRLFSKARWRENRTIFNTPNPRLMNVSLLRDNKLLHGQERRGSRMSVRLPSRQPSMASLRPHSPNASIGSLYPLHEVEI
ncbi:uncharacterized protein LOC118461363 isoform X2 [Anopheles albimanus]|nr:uncharacterized protein LOC118461363 isoform X2 [Anopheles albimanus]